MNPPGERTQLEDLRWRWLPRLKLHPAKEIEDGTGVGGIVARATPDHVDVVLDALGIDHHDLDPGLCLKSQREIEVVVARGFHADLGLLGIGRQHPGQLAMSGGGVG